MRQIKRILIRSPNWIGDHVMAEIAYKAIRTFYPEAHLTLLAPQLLIGLLPIFDAEIPISPSEKKLSVDFLKLTQRLRAEKFDLAISFPATLMSAATLFFSAIPNRIGFAKDGNEIFLTFNRPWLGREGGKHKSELYLDLIESISARKYLEKESKSQPNPVKKNIIVLAPGASIALRVWPYFYDLIYKLRKNYPEIEIHIVGATREKAWQPIIKLMRDNGVIDCIEKTTLAEIVMLCRTAQLTIANDSGVAHLSASLAGCKTFVLFGPGDPHYVLPTSQAKAVLPPALSCMPCEKASCSEAYGYQKCLKTLTVESVFEEIRLLL